MNCIYVDTTTRIDDELCGYDWVCMNDDMMKYYEELRDQNPVRYPIPPHKTYQYMVYVPNDDVTALMFTLDLLGYDSFRSF